jgi:hypothetical protein
MMCFFPATASEKVEIIATEIMLEFFFLIICMPSLQEVSEIIT